MLVRIWVQIWPGYVGVMVSSHALHHNLQRAMGAMLLELWMEIKIPLLQVYRALTHLIPGNLHPGGKSIWDKFARSAQ